MKRPPAKLCVGLVALALVNMVPTLEVEQTWGLLAIATAMGAAGITMVGSGSGARLPSWLMHLFVLGATIFLIDEMYFPHEEQTVYIIDLSHFMTLLCACKFLEMRTDRDVSLIAVISFLLLVISAFVSASLLFGVVLLIDLTIGLYWLALFQAYREEHLGELRREFALAGASLPISTGVCPGNPKRLSGASGWTGAASSQSAAPSSEAVGRPGYLRISLSCSLALVLIGGMLFVVIPRGGGGLFGGIRRIIPASVTGLSDEVLLNDTNIAEDLTPVMRVQLSQGGEPILREGFPLYMRGWTFDRYYHGRWRRTPATARQIVATGKPQSPAPLYRSRPSPPADKLIEQRIWLESGHSGILPALFLPLAIGSPDFKAIRLDPRDLSMEPASPSSGGIHYVVRSCPNPGIAELLALQRHSGSPDGPSEIPRRVVGFARRLGQEFGDGAVAADHEAIAGGFRAHLSSGEFQYSLTRGHLARNIDPIEDFLFNEKRGHCEFFASAMTLLCQAAGLRARLVNGYYGDEINEMGEFYQLRAKDAHAWVEVFLEGKGWTAFDPSPASDATRRRQVDPGLIATAQRWIEFLHFKWATLVVSFDSESRASLIERFTNWAQNLQEGRGPGSASTWGQIKALLWGPDGLNIGQRIFYWLLLLLVVLFVALFLRVFWILSLIIREYLPARPKPGVRATRRPEARFYDRLLLLLANKGHVKSRQHTPLEFAARLARTHGDMSELPMITHWFYEAQYGGESIDAERMACIRGFLRRLREDAGFGTH